eukprot:787540_1
MSDAQKRKLLAHRSNLLGVEDPGLAVLSSIPSSVPIALISIIGSLRGGKSTLMNCVSGDTIFKVSNAWGTPCTSGVDISSSLMPKQLFEWGENYRKSSDRVPLSYLGFLDVERQGTIAEAGRCFDSRSSAPFGHLH